MLLAPHAPHTRFRDTNMCAGLAAAGVVAVVFVVEVGAVVAVVLVVAVAVQ